MESGGGGVGDDGSAGRPVDCALDTSAHAPDCVVGAGTDFAVNLKDALTSARHQPNYLEPRVEVALCIVKDCPCSNRKVIASAVSADQDPGFCDCHLGVYALWAANSVWPPLGNYILHAGVFRRKSLCQLLSVIHGSTVASQRLLLHSDWNSDVEYGIYRDSPSDGGGEPPPLERIEHDVI